MSSTLVETVSINYEDFSESFLTCGTCLCPYDQTERRPKLLACSHTVCAQCLQRIAELPPSLDTGNLRCPICREAHAVPRGGVGALPPSFLVNQLIDLMRRQRRDVVPKCALHPAEELLFCETCDAVFCALCSDPTDVSSACHNHTIVPFSIAIKRMSEILLYKANQCVKNLNRAADNVQKEMTDLDRNVDRILDEVNSSFQELAQLLDSRRKELIESVRRTRDEKRRVLQEQLGIIQAEKAKVEQQCNGLQYQVEVRNITRKISDLNVKLDTTLTLVEPRENAFLRYDSTTQDVLKGIQLALAHFGTLSVSQTFPSLCRAESQPAAVFVAARVRVTTVDYHGQARTSGGDPVDALLTAAAADEHHATPPHVGVVVTDNDDGTYDLAYRAPRAGRYRMSIRIFGRQIRDSPVELTVSAHHAPVLQFGSLGTGDAHLRQPVRVSCGVDGQLFVLDTGNNRVKVLTAEGFFVRHISGEGLSHQSAVGLAVLPGGAGAAAHLLTLNWRTRAISEWTLDGNETRSFSFSEFVEPIDLAADARGRVLVADNGARKVFVFDATARPLFSFPVQPPAHITAVAVGMNEDILVACRQAVQLYDSAGKFIRSIAVAPQPTTVSAINKSGGRAPQPSIGGVAVDRLTGTVLATVTDNTRTYVAVSRYKGDLSFTMDSHGAKLKRPSGICLTADKEHCLVADLGNHCVKQFRFK